MEAHKLPKFDYYLDESDPDIVLLRRQDGSYVAHFSASGATRDGIVAAAKEDYEQLIEAHVAQQQGQKPTEGPRGHQSA